VFLVRFSELGIDQNTLIQWKKPRLNIRNIATITELKKIVKRLVLQKCRFIKKKISGEETFSYSKAS